MEFLRSAKILSLLTLVSRVLGLLRDMITTAVLHASLCDALYLAWTLPNLFRNLFGEGALSSAFIPVFNRVLHEEGRDSAFLLARRVITFVGLLLGGVVVLLISLTFAVPREKFLSLFDITPEKLDQTLTFLRILLPYLAMICVIAQCQGVLNSLKVFFLPALSPILLNLVWIVSASLAGSLAFEDPADRALFIAVGIMVGGTLQLLLFAFILKTYRFPLRPSIDGKNPAFRQVMAMTVPMVLGLSAVQVNVLVDRIVAFTLIPGDGGVTHLFLGNRLMQLPLALIGIALTTAVFPLLSRLSASGDRQGMKENLSTALRIGLFLSVPSSVGLALLAHPILSLFFQRGEFTPDRIDATSSALTGYVAGIPFLISVMLLTRAFYAMRQWKQPLVVSGCLVALNIALDLLLVRPFAEAGVAFATSIAAVIQCGALAFFLRKTSGPLGGWRILKGAGGTAALSLGLGLTVAGLLWIIGPEGPDDSLTGKAVRVFLPLFAGAAVYLIPARKVCPSEWKSLIEALSRKRRGAD